MTLNLKIRPTLTLSLTLMTQLLFFGFSSNAMASSSESSFQRKPSYRRLIQAKERLFTIKRMIEDLISKADGSDQGDGNDDSDEHRPRPRFPHLNGLTDIESEDDSIPENDFLARKLLVRINLSLEDLAEKMDQATAVYHDDHLFLQKQKHVCLLDRRIYKANQGAKTASQLPRMGNLKPSDFSPIDQELIAIETDFGC